MKKIFLTVNVILLSFISCSYYSNKIERKNNPSKTRQNEIKLIQEKTSETTQKENGNLTLPSSENQKFTVLQLTNRRDVQYYSDIYIGIPKKKMSVIFDTGSNILWVPSAQCTSCRENSLRYNPLISKSSEKINKKKSISFAVGFVEGDLYSDTVSLNSQKSFFKSFNNEIRAEKFNFLSVNNEKNLSGTASDGVMGLGIYNEGDPYNSYIETLYNQKQINSPSFSFYLFGVNNISRLYVGDILNNVYIAKLFKDKKQECIVDSNNLYWECYPFKGIKLINNDKNKTFYTNSSIIFDTGSSYTLIPKNDFMAIFNFLKLDHNCMINIDNQLVCQCLKKNEFGKIEIHFDDKNKFVMNLNEMIEYYHNNNYQCHFQINMELYDLNTWVLGDSALRKNLINFNMYERKISFIQNISGIIDDNKIAQNKWIYKNGSWFYTLLFWFIIIVTIGLLVLFILYLIK